MLASFFESIQLDNMSITKALLEYLGLTKNLGLPEADYNSALEFLEYNEYGLCFDNVVTQMYEYEIG